MREKIMSKFQEFLNALSDYEEELAQGIADLAKEKDWQTIEKRAEYARRIESFKEKAESWKGEIENLLRQDEEQGLDESEYLSEQSASDRTTWEIQGDQIRVVTKKGSGSGYSNVFSIYLFTKLVECALDFIKDKGYVKTSDVLDKMEDYIRDNSDYKKTPRLPVYVAFKVCLKENLFTNNEGNSHRYTLCASEGELLKFLKRLRNYPIRSTTSFLFDGPDPK